MTDADSRAWWHGGVLGRLDQNGREDIAPLLPRLGNDDDGLGLDGLIVRPASEADGIAALDAGRTLGLRTLIDLTTAEGAEAATLVRQARRWLDAGADGISLDLATRHSPPRGRVTQLYGTPGDGDGHLLTPAEAVRVIVDEHHDCTFVARRMNDPVAGPPCGPHLVVETTLTRKPWRAATLGLAIESTIQALPVGSWPGYAMGAPRRGPFAVGLAMEDALTCSAALHLTMRGTPCIELEAETELPQNEARRSWYRRLIELRRSEPALHRGTFRKIGQEKSVLGYLREYEADRLAVLLNLGRRTRVAHLPTGFGWTVLLGSGVAEGHRFAGGEISLPGCGVLIARAGTPQSRTLGGAGQRRATGR